MLLFYYLLKINYGNLLLQALLEFWVPPPQGSQSNDDESIKGNGYYKVPKHTPVIIR